MNVEDAIEMRKSVRKYENKKIDRDDILSILDAGRLAPFAKNAQSFHFVVIEKDAIKNDIADIVKSKYLKFAEETSKSDEVLSAKIVKFANKFAVFYKDAPVFVLIMADEYQNYGFNEYKYMDKNSKPYFELMYKRNATMLSVGAVAENIILRGVELGYGTCFISSVNIAAKEIESYLKENNIFDKENYFLSSMISIGKEVGDTVSPSKNDLTDICTFV